MIDWLIDWTVNYVPDSREKLMEIYFLNLLH